MHHPTMKRDLLTYHKSNSLRNPLPPPARRLRRPGYRRGHHGRKQRSRRLLNRGDSRGARDGSVLEARVTPPVKWVWDNNIPPSAGHCGVIVGCGRSRSKLATVSLGLRARAAGGAAELAERCRKKVNCCTCDQDLAFFILYRREAHISIS